MQSYRGARTGRVVPGLLAILMSATACSEGLLEVDAPRPLGVAVGEATPPSTGRFYTAGYRAGRLGAADSGTAGGRGRVVALAQNSVRSSLSERLFDLWPGTANAGAAFADLPPDADDGNGDCNLGSYACGGSAAWMGEEQAWGSGTTFTQGGKKGGILLLGWAYLRQGWHLPVAAPLYCSQLVGTGCSDIAGWDNSCYDEWNEVRVASFHSVVFLNTYFRGNTSSFDNCFPAPPIGWSGPTWQCETVIVEVDVWQSSSGTWVIEEQSEVVCDWVY